MLKFRVLWKYYVNYEMQFEDSFFFLRLAVADLFTPKFLAGYAPLGRRQVVLIDWLCWHKFENHSPSVSREQQILYYEQARIYQ